MEEYERVREKVAQWLWCQEAGYTWTNDAVGSYETELAKKTYRGQADQILALDGICVKADDSDPPYSEYVDGIFQSNEKWDQKLAKRSLEKNSIYEKAQEDMLKADKEGRHFVKVVPKCLVRRQQ